MSDLTELEAQNCADICECGARPKLHRDEEGLYYYKCPICKDLAEKKESILKAVIEWNVSMRCELWKPVNEERSLRAEIRELNSLLSEIPLENKIERMGFENRLKGATDKLNKITERESSS